MTEQKDARTLSDELNDNIRDMRTLLNAMDDQLCFCLSNRKLLGVHLNEELLRCCVSQVSGLLTLSQTILARMDGNADALSELLYYGTQSGDPE